MRQPQGNHRGRDEDYATITRSLVTNMGVSGKLRKTHPEVFNDDDLVKRGKRAVFNAFELLSRLDVVAR